MKKTTKMWGGRFSQGTSGEVEDFTQSVVYDKAMYAQDIKGSQAHARMLGRQGVISTAEVEALCTGLDKVLVEIESGKFVWKESQEDLHMNIEQRLTDLIGDVGKKLHTGRSRNDQVALDFRLFVSDSLAQWKLQLRRVIAALAAQAKQHSKTILPGCTHLQPGQPISLAQHLLAYAWMLKRDYERLEDTDKRTRISPLGAAAMAGTTYPVDPESVACELGLNGCFDNSMDAVSDRDFVLESLFCASLIMAHLSRFCEDVILWANPAFGFINLPDAYSTGSSIMPQKKNPDVAELTRGKCGRVYGALMGLLATVKGLPMTYNRDLQEDKEPFLDANRTVFTSLSVMVGMVEALTFNPERMLAALKRGFVNATELADYLVGRGIPFREAHHLTGQAVALAESRSLGLEDLPLADLQAICPKIEKDVYKVLEFAVAVARRESPGGTGPKSVAKQLKKLEKFLK